MKGPSVFPLRILYGRREILVALFFQAIFSGAGKLFAPPQPSVCWQGESEYGCGVHWFLILELFVFGMGAFWIFNGRALFLTHIDARSLRLPQTRVLWGNALMLATVTVTSLIIPLGLLWPYLGYWNTGIPVALLGAVSGAFALIVPRWASGLSLLAVVAILHVFPGFETLVITRPSVLWLAVIMIGVIAVARWKWLSRSGNLDTAVRIRLVAPTAAGVAHRAETRSIAATSNGASFAPSRNWSLPRTLAIRTMLGPPFRLDFRRQAPWIVVSPVAVGAAIRHFVPEDAGMAVYLQLAVQASLPILFLVAIQRTFVHPRAELVEICLAPAVAARCDQRVQLLYALIAPPVLFFLAAMIVQCVIIAALKESASGYVLAGEWLSLQCLLTLASNVFTATQGERQSGWVRALPTITIVFGIAALTVLSGRGILVISATLAAHPWAVTATYLTGLSLSFVLVVESIRRYLAQPNAFLPYR